MEKVGRRAAWALLICLLAMAGFTIGNRIYGAVTDPGVRLVLNIPASRLDVLESGIVTRSYPVSAGARGFQTPAGNYRVYQITWNPSWHPPGSAWARSWKPQPPGPENPMGRVKLQFAKLLYIHGTTEENDLGAPASHGCVRMSNRDLMALARLLHIYTTPDVTPVVLETLRNNPRQTRNFALSRAVPLVVKYDLVEVRDRTLIIHPNVYRIENADVKKQVLAVLQQQGIDAGALSGEQLERITRVRNATRLRVPLDTLLSGAGTESR
ncbi:MAG: L,D-transpeptidase [Longimicrobiales bacterium]